MSFQVDFLIPPDHNEFVAELLMNGQFILRVTREDGLEAAKVEFFQGDQERLFVCELSEFEEALRAAKAGLEERRRRERNSRQD